MSADDGLYEFQSACCLAAADGPAEQDKMKPDVENVIGMDGDDRLVGNDGSNTLDGRGGNDFLDGSGG